MTNLDSVLKSREIILPAKLCIVETMVFPVVVWMWELDHKEGWELKNWCFWTVVLEKTSESLLRSARRSNQSILKEINPECSLEGLMLKLKLQYFDHLLQRADSFEKNPDAGKDWRQEEKGTTEDEMVGWHHQFCGHEFEQTLRNNEGREAWRAAVHGVTKSWIIATEQQQLSPSPVWSIMHRIKIFQVSNEQNIFKSLFYLKTI